MPVFDLYSKRRKRLSEPQNDMYSYDEISNALRVQILQILKDAFGSSDLFRSQTDDAWASIHKLLCREYGKFSLGTGGQSDYLCVANHFLSVTAADKALDFIEVAFKHVNVFGNDFQFKMDSRPKLSPAEAIGELNIRFREAGIGYEFVADQILRKDSEFIHSDVVLPAIALLRSKKFSGANEEYLSAHEHYKAGKAKEALNDCLKAFESTMKTICDMKKWEYDSKVTAKTLIEICFTNELIPAFLQSELGALRSALESGIPTVRNRLGGHGQGQVPVEVPLYYASYLLNLTAATIVFLVKAAE